MSQLEVFIILKELGGKATTSMISQRAKEKFPELSLHQYVNDRLKKLRDNGYISSNAEQWDARKKVVWRIVDESILTNRNIVQLSSYQDSKGEQNLSMLLE